MRDSGERTVLSVSGPDAEEFLQDLVTNDLHRRGEGLVYAALLTPQGKYLADFMISGSADSLLLDVAAPLADVHPASLLLAAAHVPGSVPRLFHAHVPLTAFPGL